MKISAYFLLLGLKHQVKVTTNLLQSCFVKLFNNSQGEFFQPVKFICIVQFSNEALQSVLLHKNRKIKS